MVTDLLEHCSLKRSGRQRWAHLYGQNAASVARWPSHIGRSSSVKRLLTPAAA